MKILHTADIHLRTASDPRWHALCEVLETAKRIDADVVVVAGDLFDRDVDAHELRAPLRSVFEACGLPVLLLPGNHDYKGLRAGDYYGEHVRVLSRPGECADVGDVRFVPLPFVEGGAARTLERIHEAHVLVAPGRTNVLLYHGELLDLVPGGGAFGDEESDYMPARLASFGGLGFDYVLSGHFHKSYAVHRYDGGYFVYPGSPVSITTKETGRRRADVVVPGQAPAPLELDTFHFEARRVRLDPFDERHPVDVVDAELSGLHPKAEVILTVDGFVNLGGIGMTETELRTALNKQIARWRVKDLDARYTDVRDVVDHDLFKKFGARLARTSVPAEKRVEMQDLVIRCLTELIYAR